MLILLIILRLMIPLIVSFSLTKAFISSTVNSSGNLGAGTLEGVDGAAAIDESMVVVELSGWDPEVGAD